MGISNKLLSIVIVFIFLQSLMLLLGNILMIIIFGKGFGVI